MKRYYYLLVNLTCTFIILEMIATNKTLNKNPLIFKVVSTCAYEKVCNYETK